MIFYLGLGAALFLFAGKLKASQDAGARGLPVQTNWNRFDLLFQKYGAKYGVSWQWLKAIAMNESSLGAAKSVAHGLRYPNDVEESKSSDGKSWGLMQVTLTTARDLDPTATEAKLNNPEYSIDLAAKYIGKYIMPKFSSFDSRFLEWVIKSYNQGAGNTGKEKSGYIKGYAGEYWERFKRNLQKVKESEQ